MCYVGIHPLRIETLFNFMCNMNSCTFSTKVLEGSEAFLDGIKEATDEAISNLSTTVSILSRRGELAIDSRYFSELMTMLQTISRMSCEQKARLSAELDIRRAVEFGNARASRVCHFTNNH